ncbi:MAG: glycosyltransferase family 61 protein [Rhodobacteraceae bacterium]|nr:glycosyltransferase family 61 protein [Paracoccaceae bacterium]
MNLEDKLPPIGKFKDVVVVPLINPATGERQENGPIWPDWDSQQSARFCRGGSPVDKRPDNPAQIDVYVDGPLIWGGSIHPHFGHFIAEYASRILQSQKCYGDVPFLFGCSNRPLARAGTIDKAPAHFLPTVRWLGLNSEQIRFCTQNMKISTLLVASQAEQLVALRRKRHDLTLSSEYLDLLDQNVLRNNLLSVPNKLVFVSRAKLAPHLDRYAGSVYLDELLKSLGAFVFYPERHTLTEQLAVYAGAENLIFAEGSAIHGLQLLGRGLGAVTILNRRKGTLVAEYNLRPRCKELQYFDIMANVFAMSSLDKLPHMHCNMATFDLDCLFAAFLNSGIDLSKNWDAVKYQIAVKEDMKSWVVASGASLKKRGRDIGEQTELLELLKSSGHKNVHRFAEKFIKENLV